MPSTSLQRIALAAIAFALPMLPTPARADSNYQVDASFNNTNGANPQCGLVQASDGNFYGTALNGGSPKDGTLFEYNQSTQALTAVHTFGDGSIPNDGANPNCPLTLGSDGNLYGVTTNGPNGDGTLFKYSLSTGVLTILHVFGDGSTPNDGADPCAALVEGQDGNFYGTTQYGGSAGDGSIYEFNTSSGAVTILHSFADGTVASDGTRPFDALAFGSDGNLYGTTVYGGSASNGTLFEYNVKAGTETILHSFGDGSVPNDGSNGSASVVLANDGSFYGVTSQGGAANDGAIFRYTPSTNEFAVVHSFSDGTVANDGNLPVAPLASGADGNLYSTTLFGGSQGAGVVYEYNLQTGSTTIIHSFGDGGGPNDGGGSLSGLVETSDGVFYGTTAQGGTSNVGAIFSFNQPTDSSISASSSANPSVWYQPLTFSATVSSSGGSSTPSGNVTFSLTDPNGNSIQLGSSAIDGNGVADINWAGGAQGSIVGNWTLTAVYNGDANNEANSTTLTQTINKASTSTSLSVDHPMITVGQSVTLSAFVSDVAPSDVSPDDDPVEFFDGGNQIGTVYTSQGAASLTTSTLSVGKHSLTAHFIGANNRNSSVSPTVTVTVAAGLKSVVLSPTSVQGGTAATTANRVYWTGNAPANETVTLKSSNTAVATVPSSVTISSGSSSHVFTITTKAVTSTQTVTITATSGGVTQTATLTVTPPPSVLKSVVLSPTSTKGGTSTTANRVYWTGNAPANETITLTSNNKAVATVPSTVTIDSGSSSHVFTITTKAVTSQQTVTITATSGGVTQTATLTVTP